MPLANDPAGLERRLREKEPAARLISERAMLAHLREAGADTAPNPQRPVRADGSLLLLAPADRGLHNADDASVLAEYSRLLFRAAVEASRRAETSHISAPFLSPPPQRLAEIRFVLAAEGLLPADASDADVVAAFIPVYLDLLVHQPEAISDWFPLVNRKECDELVSNINWQPLLKSTRLSSDAPRIRTSQHESTPLSTNQVRAAEATDRRAMARGNIVRGALILTRTAMRTSGQTRGDLTAAARGAIRDSLIGGLGKVFGWSERQRRDWTAATTPFLSPAATGIWPSAARALYDLQRLAADLAGSLDAVAPVEWLRSFFRQPLRRSLDRVRDVILLRRLQLCETHALNAEVAPGDRKPFLELLHQEMASADTRVRRSLGPVITAACDDSGLIPKTDEECFARDKLVAEILDRLCQQGFLRFADLRDAVAGNELKMPDVRLREMIRGDSLLQLDARLAIDLFGVYHRAEIYLRGIQKFSSLSFATPLGRFLTRYVVLPFGGAFLALEFLQHVVHGAGAATEAIGRYLGRINTAVDEEYFGYVEPPPPLEFVSILSVGLLGIFLLALLYVPAFRRSVLRGLSVVGNVIRVALFDTPRAVFRSGPVRLILDNRLTRAARRYAAFPAGITLLLMAVLAVYDVHPKTALKAGGTVFVFAALMCDSPAGRRMQRSLAESTADAWRYFWTGLLPGVFTWLIWFFRELVSAVERFLYIVDESFRYRAGQSQPSLVAKAVLGLIWFPIAYVVRFAFNLLLEPQINPLKHFPVVTVSHKVLLPLIGTVRTALKVSIETAGVIVGCIPGIFGFLVWEFQTNWRLYAANKPAAPPPAPIGHHGETVRGLLRPGFHSGTVPKLFRKLRAADAHDDPAAVDRLRHDLHHIADSLRHLLERDVLPVWNNEPALAKLELRVEDVRIGCQRIEVEIAPAADDPLIVAFDHREGLIEGTIVNEGWIASVGRTIAEPGLERIFARAACRGSV